MKILSIFVAFSENSEINWEICLKNVVFPQYLNFTLQGKGNYYSKDFLLFFRSYIVFAGTSIQPGEPYKVAVTLFRNSNKKTYSFPFGPYDNLPATIQVQISRKGSVIISEIRECHFGSTELIIVTVSFTFPWKIVLPWIVSPPCFPNSVHKCSKCSECPYCMFWKKVSFAWKYGVLELLIP